MPHIATAVSKNACDPTSLQLGATHEQVRLILDEESGLETIIAVHNTMRGPAFGGCRYQRYQTRQGAITDALRLSEGMTLKNALAGLPFGGGKAVIRRNRRQTDRARLFQAFGRAVEEQGGAYITAEDVGTTDADMREVQKATSHVSGISRDGRFGGNPSPKTAHGVFVGIRAAVTKLLRRSTLEGTSVAVQGLGAVGWALCARLSEAGCSLFVTDLDEQRVIAAQEQFRATAVRPGDILTREADVVAPCALGAVLNGHSVTRIRASIVAGAANNQLSMLEDGDQLHARGVFYVPDFLINAGGVISVAREHLGASSEASVMAEVGQIAGRVDELIQRVRTSGKPPARVALDWARSRIARL